MPHEHPAIATEPAAHAVEIHVTQFHRNQRTGLWRGLCTCGWVTFGEREEVQSKAAAHDMDWIAVDPTAPASGVSA